MPKIKVTTKELAKRMDVEYAQASGLLKILEAKKIAVIVETRPNPTGRGKGSKVYEIPSEFTIEV